MTHAAAATPTLHTSRRRTHGPAAWERAGAVSGVVGAAAIVVAACILSWTPSVDATPAVVRRHLSGHYTVMMTLAYAIVVAALLLVPLLASLRTFTARRTDVAQWRWTVTLVAGAIGIVMLTLAGALLATATLLAHHSTADQSVFVVFVAAKLVATVAILPVAGVVVANARAIATTERRPELWLIRFDIEIATFAVVGSIASFVDRDWLAPGETVAAGAWLLVALWIVALARTIARGDHPDSSEEHS
jgi:hypothetical protein